MLVVEIVEKNHGMGVAGLRRLSREVAFVKRANESERWILDRT